MGLSSGPCAGPEDRLGATAMNGVPNQRQKRAHMGGSDGLKANGAGGKKIEGWKRWNEDIIIASGFVRRQQQRGNKVGGGENGKTLKTQNSKMKL